MEHNIKYEFNLRVLKRHYSDIESIIDIACQAFICKYSQEAKNWELAGVDGALFLVKRRSFPFYGFFILNRKSLEDFYLPLSDETPVTIDKDSFVFPRSEATPDPIAIWFYDKEDQKRLAAQLIKICRSGYEKLEAQTKSSLATQATKSELAPASNQASSSSHLSHPVFSPFDFFSLP